MDGDVQRETAEAERVEGARRLAFTGECDQRELVPLS